MKIWLNRFAFCGLWLGALLLLGVPTAFPKEAESLLWRSQENKVDAEIRSWDLQKLLGEISAATGWQVFLEPDTQHTVSATFKDLRPGDALRLLLGDLNFALLPQSNAPAKFFIYRTSLLEATQLIAAAQDVKPPPRPSDLIPNELIVTLKPNAKETIDDIARKLGAKVVGRADDLKAYRLQFEDEAATQSAREALEAYDSVEDVDSNFTVHGPTRTEKLALSSPMPFSLRPKVSTDASRIVVGLIDTAVQSLGPQMNEFMLSPLRVAGEPASDVQQLSHGTSMAETILQGLSMASRDSEGSPVRILPVDVYGTQPNTTTFDVGKGVYAAINGGATIINLSLGGDGESPFLNGIIQNAHKQGVLFFGAAGNEPSTIPVYPAAYPDVVAVTAGDKKGNIAPYANRGSFVDVVAPGVSLVQFMNQSFLVSGTSAATAYVSGTASAQRAAGKSASEAEEFIRQALAVKPPAKK